MRVAVTGHRGLSMPVEALIANEIDRELDRMTATGAELTGLSCLADGEPARAFGGTADVVAYAREICRPVTIIWPDGATR